MRKTTTITCAALALAAAIAGCGSSSTTKAAGVQTAPSAGLTSATSTAAASTATSTSAAASATSTTTSSTPLPAALKTKPKVSIPSGAPPSKLVIKDTGAAATASSTVNVQYVGELYKGGKQFDASWNDGSGQPVSLPLTGVIKGWQQGIPGMKIGGRRELIIPPSLGYGATAQAKIPANSTLVFVIDLHGLS